MENQVTRATITTPEFRRGQDACDVTVNKFSVACAKPGPGLDTENTEFRAGYKYQYRNAWLPLLDTPYDRSK